MQPASNTNVPHRSAELDETVFDALLSSVDQRIWWKDVDRRFLGCNQAFASGFGFSRPDELIGLTDYDLPLPPALARKFELDDRRVLETGIPVTRAESWLDQGTTSGYVRFSLVPLTDHHGTIVGLLGISTDISDRVAVEQQLLAERDVLNKVLSHIPSQIAWKDRGHRYLGANPSYKALVGLESADDIAGMTAADPTGRVAEEWLALDEGNETVMANGEAELHQRSTIQHGHRTRHLDVSRIPLTDAQGTVTGILVMLADVTERLALETRLAESSKMEAIGQLASGVAHEINTPIQYVGDNLSFLRSITGEVSKLLFRAGELAEAIANEQDAGDKADALLAALADADVEFLNDEVPRAVEQSFDGIERVRRIVRALKEFAHPGGEDPEPTNLNDVVNSTVSVTANEWKYVAELELDLDPDLPDVSCRPGKIGQVVLILVVNAAQAIAEHRTDDDPMGRITVATRTTPETVDIEVSDTGGGIPDDVLPRIFEPFYTTKDVGTGSGQGLSLAHAIVTRDHGGVLSVDTDPGSGTTTFVVTIPREVHTNVDEAI